MVKARWLKRGRGLGQAEPGLFEIPGFLIEKDKGSLILETKRAGNLR